MLGKKAVLYSIAFLLTMRDSSDSSLFLPHNPFFCCYAELLFLIELSLMFSIICYSVDERRSDIRYSCFTRPNAPFLAENSSNF